MKIFSFFVLCFILLHSNNAVESQKENQENLVENIPDENQENSENQKSAALIFSQETQQLVEMVKGDQKTRCLSCLIACPAFVHSHTETSINNLVSITQKSLFFRNSYKNAVLEVNMEIDICYQPFKPGMAYDIETHSYEIGYELYLDTGKTKLRGSEFFPFNNFRKIIHNRVYNEEPYDNVLVKKYAQSTGRITTLRVDTLSDEPLRTLVFYWAAVLSIRFSKHHRHIKFAPDVINKHTTIEKCEHYTIEDEMIKRQIENIRKQSSPPTFTKDHPESTCVENHDCLEPTQIMPMIYVHTYASKLATCTHLNLAFIWGSVANNHLKEVDRYLFAVLRHWYSAITIIFGIQGESELQKKMTLLAKSKEIKLTISKESTEDTINSGQPGEKPEEKKIGIELTENIPIPELMYRMVEYRLKHKTYRVLIIIHNERVSVPVEDRICLEKDEVAGWSRIKNDNVETGLTYACPVTQKTLEKLGEYGGTLLAYSGVLRLDEFPVDKNKIPLFPAKIEFEDETENVAKEYENIFSNPPAQSTI
ncbi:uncharacterized protein LOC135847676 [Planococcus citri]|uniref:uncharacterized protein LOC135847676 n=1 Tax=Planococcus citri TaxID=170843 RepID=UPI0031F992DB